VLEEIPNDSAATLILLEHHSAVPLRDAVVRAGGFRISDGFISPRDLVEIGLHSAEEAEVCTHSKPSHRTTNTRTPAGKRCLDLAAWRAAPLGA